MARSVINTGRNSYATLTTQAGIPGPEPRITHTAEQSTKARSYRTSRLHSRLATNG
jgi:hypothetical protein